MKRDKKPGKQWTYQANYQANKGGGCLRELGLIDIEVSDSLFIWWGEQKVDKTRNIMNTDIDATIQYKVRNDILFLCLQDNLNCLLIRSQRQMKTDFNMSLFWAESIKFS